MALENEGRQGRNPSAPRLHQLHSLPANVAAQILLDRFQIVVIDLADNPHADETMVLALYLDDVGIYSTSEREIFRVLSELCPELSYLGRKEVLSYLSLGAERVLRTIDPDLIPVSNGIFKHSTQELLPFSPEYVFLGKIAVAYNTNALSPTIVMPDGEPWDFDTWIEGLSDDEGVAQLLWEVISAAIRSHVSWNVAILLTGLSGKNGKGTFVALLRNLIGQGNYAAVPIHSFSDRFKKYELIRASVNLVDENKVNTYLDDATDYKAVITGDVFCAERKGRDPVWLRWRGFMLQCLNEVSVRTRDKSRSLVRRHLMIPFNKKYGVGERKYIKEDFLAREEVLEYVLRKALAMTHSTFSVPPVCAALLQQAHGRNSSPIAFWEEFCELFIWDLLPWDFLYDLFKSWHLRNEPSGRIEGKVSFCEAIKEHLAGSTEWEETLQRPGTRMNDPELLIDEYGLDRWTNSSYPGSDPNKKCIPSPLKANYRGLGRIISTGTAPAAAGVSTD